MELTSSSCTIMLTPGIESALKLCATRSEFVKRFPRLYDYCARHKLLGEVNAQLPSSKGKRTSAVTLEMLLANSASHPNVKSWIEAGRRNRLEGKPCYFSIAASRGRAVLEQCTPMNKRVPPVSSITIQTTGNDHLTYTIGACTC